MGTRNGLQAFTKIAHSLCRLLGTWQAPITAAINASSLSSEDKASAIAYIAAANTACGAFVKLMTKWEQ
jgi:hypothetical protein